LRAEVHERKRAEERLTILVQELAHRVKNLLSVFQSITSRTLTGTRTVEEAREMLIGRLQSLGHAHELLTETSWMGADLKDIVQAEIAGFTERVRFSGPAVSLSPSGVQTFALIVHELSTNAAKYGALSSTNGEVVVDWQLGGSGNGRYMEFSWREKGGPQVIPDQARRLRPVADQRHGQQCHVAPDHRFCTGRLPLYVAGAARDDCADPLRSGLADARRRPCFRAARRRRRSGRLNWSGVVRRCRASASECRCDDP
jgi:two-component sensor histidine kinase